METKNKTHQTSGNGESVTPSSFRVVLVSTLILVLIAIGITEGFRFLISLLVPSIASNEYVQATPLGLGMAFILIFDRHIIQFWQNRLQNRGK